LLDTCIAAALYFNLIVQTKTMCDSERCGVLTLAHSSEVPLETQRTRGCFVGESSPVRSLRDQLHHAAATSLPVLLYGESGTRKDLAARIIHRESVQREGRFVPISLAGIPDTVMAAMLLGQVKGALSNDDRERPGLFELACRGTMFLGEMGAATPQTQSLLLSILEFDSVQRPGEDTIRPIVRVISATNQNLWAMVAAGEFRLDLLRPLTAIQIRMPPLRERREDIPELVESVLQGISHDFHRPISLTSDAIAALQEYDFPGNLRELENVLQRAAYLTDRPPISVKHLCLPRNRPAVNC